MVAKSPKSKAKLILVILLFTQVCVSLAIWKMSEEEPARQRPTNTAPDPVTGDRFASNRRMAALLNSIEIRQPLVTEGPQSSRDINHYRKQILNLQKSDQKPERLLEYQYKLADALLNTDRPNEAIVEFEKLIGLSGKLPNSIGDRVHLLTRMAICHLRLGEQSNCILHHTADSCIFPLKGGGIHQDPSGAKRAIEYYLVALESEPGRLDLRWLLNLAYMALDEYPQRVPEKWLIPPKCFESDYNIGRFVDVAARIGLNTVTRSGGCVIEDFDNDGYLDVIVSSSGDGDPLRYYVNQANGHFEERTKVAMLTGLNGGLNMCHGDFNNDGYVDVYVIRGAWFIAGLLMPPNSLLMNLGDGTFQDVTEAAGLLEYHPGLSAAWADFDNDGWLDLAVGNETRPGQPAHPFQLFRNNRDGTFTDCSRDVGLSVQGFFRGVAWGDYNNDGRQDLYLSDMNEENILFKNTPNGFIDVTDRAGVQGPHGSFAAWFWDYNNDGWLDLFAAGNAGASPGEGAVHAVVAAFLAKGGFKTDDGPYNHVNSLYRNNGDGTFTNLAAQAGLALPTMPMGANFGDLDNDGYPDFYIGTGDIDFSNLVPNRMFRNNGGQSFQDVTTSGGFGHLQKGHGIAFADLDNDGDQDVYASFGGFYEGDVFQNAVFLNPGHGNHWISLRLEGRRTNRSAVGARIRVRVDTPNGKRDIYGVVSSGGSFGSTTYRQDIGLGEARAITFLEITWPTTGEIQRFEEVEIDQSLKLIEGGSLQRVELKRLDFGGHDRGTAHNQLLPP